MKLVCVDLLTAKSPKINAHNIDGLPTMKLIKHVKYENMGHKIQILTQLGEPAQYLDAEHWPELEDSQPKEKQIKSIISMA